MLEWIMINITFLYEALASLLGYRTSVQYMTVRDYERAKSELDDLMKQLEYTHHQAHKVSDLPPTNGGPTIN